MSVVELDEGSDIWFRPDKQDQQVIAETPVVYGPLAEFARPSDVFLDIGAHIGTVSRLMLGRGLRAVAVEPDPDSFAVLQRNVAGLDATTFHAAVGDSDGTTTLYPHPDMPFLTTVVPSPWRTSLTVPMLGLEGMLMRHRPRIVKCDIEFGEYGLTSFTALPAFVEGLAIEVHIRRDRLLQAPFSLRQVRHDRSAALAFIDMIERQGFRRLTYLPKQRPCRPVHDRTGLAPQTTAIDMSWTR